VKVGLATCAEMPAGDEDEQVLVAALRAAGHEPVWATWDDAGVDWNAFDVTLVRSTWDYQRRRDEYVAWAQGVPRLHNPATVLEWNTDKVYLGELREAGLPVVPTIFCPPGTRLPLLEAEVVVKPTISAGSRDTARFKDDEERGAEMLLKAIHLSGRTGMVQPYVPSVDERGETALLYFGGTFSHAIQKAPLLRRGAAPTGGLFAPESITPREPTARERAVADRVVAWVAERFGGSLAYARVDLVEGPGGGPLVLELELTEPSLFFLHAPGAAARLTRWLSDHLATERT
jgi:glutathione synthase/RimK-type ligase-like ATP-grasp enzyme